MCNFLISHGDYQAAMNYPLLGFKIVITYYVLPHLFFLQPPPKFVAEYKNPCFQQRQQFGSTLQCLPQFLVIGAQKCGTTDLYKKMGQHPNIINSMKEPFWYNRLRLGDKGVMGAQGKFM